MKNLHLGSSKFCKKQELWLLIFLSFQLTLSTDSSVFMRHFLKPALSYGSIYTEKEKNQSCFPHFYPAIKFPFLSVSEGFLVNNIFKISA